MSLRQILVPHDGSPFARRALSLAVPIAQQHGARLALVQASGLPPRARSGLPLPASSGDTADLRRNQAAALGRLATRLRQRYAIETTFDYREGDVLPQLEQAVVQHQAELVVMATHGRSGVSRFWLGSVAEALLRHLHVPMLLTRTERKYTKTLPEEPIFPRAVIALDGSTHAEQALAAATTMLGDTRPQLVLAQVLVAPAVPASPSWIAEASARMQDEYLEPIAARLRAGGHDVVTRVPVAADAARGILDVVKEEHASLLALATHGRTGTRRLLLGSVADKLIRAAPVPMLVSPMS